MVGGRPPLDSGGGRETDGPRGVDDAGEDHISLHDRQHGPAANSAEPTPKPTAIALSWRVSGCSPRSTIYSPRRQRQPASPCRQRRGPQHH